MISVMDWLMNLPPAERIETAAHVIEQLRGGDTRAQFLARTLGIFPQQARILAMLEARAPAIVSPDQLATALWMEATGDRERNAVSVALARVRKILPPDAIVNVFGQGYRLNCTLPPSPPPGESLDDLRARHRLPRAQSLRPNWRRWTEQDDDDLRAMIASGSDLPIISDELGRTPRAIRNRTRHLGLNQK